MYLSRFLTYNLEAILYTFYHNDEKLHIRWLDYNVDAIF